MTSYLARQLQNNKPHEVLKMLNSNSENPYLVWNNGTRSELTKFLEEQRDSAVRRGESDPGKPDQGLSSAYNLLFCSLWS